MQRAFDGPLPASIELFALIGAHLRLECAVNRPMLSYFLLAAPEANREASEVSDTKSGRLGNLWSLHRHAKDIRLELHEQIVDNSTAINAQRFQIDLAIGSHRLQHIACLVAHGFKCGTSNVTYRRTTRQTNDRAACIGI